MSQKGIISRMLSRTLEECPTMEECLQAIKCFTRPSNFTGTTNMSGHKNKNGDRTIAANCCPQTPDEIDISESILSDQLEITSSDLKDSSSPTEEELYTTEPRVSLSLETSDEEHQQAEEDEKVTRTRKPPSKMDKTVHESNPQQRHINVKMSSNKEHQRIYDKNNYCLYCEKLFAKLTRHLKQKHADKVEVAKALAHR
ncbi:uncharacterized protein LOC133641631 isoform X2 [Entelurus aequoreus]|uniref:uncharacterized protein LOC133641631 isoform X2 n=1 Tax=Entelurus aequoreus TaxID=161455 RepID=UPI002B1D056A|nr:uncharacterized protein LOC133641631 isoform X2 [Entelurus aequoreus]